MAVAIGTSSASSLLVGSTLTVTTASITAPSSNPVIMFAIGIAQTARSVVSVVSGAGLGSVSGTLVKRSAVSNGVLEIWVITAPTASGSDTVVITFDSTTPALNWQYAWSTFSGADQTTPGPIADAVADSNSVGLETQTPTNLTANDATYGGLVNVLTGNPNGVTPTQTYLDHTTACNLEAGYATGTTGLTTSRDNANQSQRVCSRIVSAITITTPQLIPAIMETMESGGMVGRVYY